MWLCIFNFFLPRRVSLPFFPPICISWTSLVQWPCKMAHILGLSECFLRIISGFKMGSKDPLVTPWTASRIRSGARNFRAILYFRGVGGQPYPRSSFCRTACPLPPQVEKHAEGGWLFSDRAIFSWGLCVRSSWGQACPRCSVNTLRFVFCDLSFLRSCQTVDKERRARLGKTRVIYKRPSSWWCDPSHQTSSLEGLQRGNMHLPSFIF